MEKKHIIWNLVEDNYSMIRRRRLCLHEQLAEAILEIEQEEYFVNVDWKRNIVSSINKQKEIRQLYEHFYIKKHEFIKTYEEIKTRINRACKIKKEYDLIMQSGILDDIDRQNVYGI